MQVNDINNIMTVTNITDFRANAKQYIDNVINDNSALIINRGNTAAVLISLEEYNSIKATQSLLESHVMSHEVAIGIEHQQRPRNPETPADIIIRGT